MASKKTNLLIVIILGSLLIIDFVYILEFQIDFYLRYHHFLYSQGLNFDTFFEIELPNIIGIIGLITFIKSKFKKTNMLRFYMVYIVCLSPLNLLFIIQRIKNIIIVISQPNNGLYNGFRTIDIDYITPVPQQIFYLLWGCFSIFICWYGLFKLSKNKVLKLTETVSENGNIYDMNYLGGKQRFVNHLIDLTIIFWITYMINQTIKSPFSLMHNNFWLELTQNHTKLELTAIIFIYYFFMEGIFGFTAGKIFTSSVVVTEAGEKPGVVQILGRTLCRLIPFEAFSFLPNATKGWHDTISSTYVVKVVDTEEQEFD